MEKIQEWMEQTGGSVKVFATRGVWVAEAVTFTDGDGKVVFNGFGESLLLAFTDLGVELDGHLRTLTTWSEAESDAS